MSGIWTRLGTWSIVSVGIGLFLIGLLSTGRIVDNFWPYDVERLDLVRNTPLDRLEATQILQAADRQSILVFLASVLVAVTGLVLPLVYFLNKRFDAGSLPRFLDLVRQSMWIGLWVAFCTWLRMNRTLGWGVALLVAAVFVVLEVLLQVRSRAAQMAEAG